MLLFVGAQEKKIPKIPTSAPWQVVPTKVQSDGDDGKLLFNWSPPRPPETWLMFALAAHKNIVMGGPRTEEPSQTRNGRTAITFMGEIKNLITVWAEWKFTAEKDDDNNGQIKLCCWDVFG